MDRIVCPKCSGVFRTIYQENKKERCPYCAHVITHTGNLRGFLPREWQGNDEHFNEWVHANLEQVNAWWVAQKGDVDTHVLDVLLARLEVINRGTTEMRRRLQDKESR